MSKDVVSANKQVLGPVIFGDQQMPWSKGVVAGGFVFLSGMVGVTDLATGNAGDIEAQTKIAFDCVKSALQEAGSSIENAVRINQYLADRSLRDRYLAARDGWMTENAPSLLRDRSYGSLMVIQQLVMEELLVEIEVTALA